MNDLISVIVPVYNSQDYLGKCIDSILSQTYKNIEILLINDGSTDNSLEVCNKYKKIDDRIIVISKANGGVSSARNYGIKKSNGKYIVFVDSDDYICSNMIECLYNAMIEHDADLVTCNIYRVNEQSNILFETYNEEKQILDSSQYFYNIFNYETAFCYPINKLYKKSILIDNNIEFNEDIHFMEDFTFVCDVISHIQIIVNINDILYYYVQRKGSATHSAFSKRWLSRFDIQKKLIDKYLNKFSEKSKTLFLYDHIMNSLSCYSFCKINRINNDYVKYKKEAKKYFDYVKNNKYLPIDKKMKIRLKYYLPIIYFNLLEAKNKKRS